MVARQLCLYGALGLGLFASSLASGQEPGEPQEIQTPAVPTELDTQETYQRALRMYRRREFSQALVELSALADLEPERADVLYLIGYCHLMQREYQSAVEAFDRAFRADPSFDPRYIYRKPPSTGPPGGDTP